MSNKRRASPGSLARRRVKLSSMLADKGTARQPEPARELYRRQPARQLQQSERVTVRLENDPIQHVLIQASGQDGLQQRPRITMP